MKNYFFSLSLRWKFFLYFVASAAITAFLLLILSLLAEFLVQFPLAEQLFRWLKNKIGYRPLTILFGCIVFVFSYNLLSRPAMNRLNRLKDGLKEMAAGNFDISVSVHSRDELEDIAQAINKLAAELNQDLRDITRGLDEISRGELRHELPVRDKHKLGEVADSINRMSARLYKSIQEERMAEKTKNDLITGVSHDLRTPLTSILGFLELIENDRHRDELELRYYVNIAYEKTLSLKKLIDDLFEYTRLSNGLPLKREQLPIANFIRQLTEEFVPSFEAAQMECRIRQVEEGLIVSADGDNLARAFENLISNAIRYGRKGVYIDIDIVSEAEHAVINISNYGDPIPSTALPFLFDRFYRVDSSRTKGSGGTGLGLAIAKSIIEGHGGTITAISDDRVTTFQTRLPRIVA
ncbi:ATP-binding protein [Paenibacillus sp. J5C_2022]|uniref:sensor histidine kinase n=1 Tax=Paenibacillus sp. J5C2022 TaxID=2977129 RepID=UPI0021CE11ED|nr:ATP-binding protein [Paenibacillus sp. J5C2022]MCU6708614.1 ATP-binding protein [Paenibacillus sp. J5C2022]